MLISSIVANNLLGMKKTCEHKLGMSSVIKNYSNGIYLQFLSFDWLTGNGVYELINTIDHKLINIVADMGR